MTSCRCLFTTLDRPRPPVKARGRCVLLVLGLMACGGDKETGEGPVEEAVDTDGDGFSLSSDCDDGDATVHPGASEVCNDVDDDCDDLVDEEDPDWDSATGVQVWRDMDGDGYGDPATAAVACADRSGFVHDGTDCDDGDADVHPSASEVCDVGVDNDCDGLADDADPDVDPSTLTSFYVDADGDGFGDPENVARACELAIGLSADATDCNDHDPEVHPGAEEVCDDGVDSDCSGDGAGCVLLGASSYADVPIEFLADASATASSFGFRLEVMDLDGDAIPDLLVAAPSYIGDDGDEGHLYMFGGPLTPGSRRADTADSTWKGQSEVGDDQLASDLRSAGDVNGDGYDDLLVGSLEAAPSGGRHQGVARLIYGGGGVGGSLDLRWVGDEVNDELGSSVIGVGDLDGDGFADLALGATGVDLGSEEGGAVYLIFGAASGLASGAVSEVASARYLASQSASGVGYRGSLAHGDFNGDGLQDILVGARSWLSGREGVVYLHLGSGAREDGDVPLESSSDANWGGSGVELLMGETVTGLGDLDGDGFDDLAVAEPNYAAYSGALYLFLGHSTVSGSHDTGDAWATWRGSRNEYLGQSHDAGDLNADGAVDLALGAGYWSDGSFDRAGAAFVYYGPLSGGTRSTSDADASVEGDVEHQYLGRNDLRLTDVDGDGIDDLVLPGFGFSETGLYETGGLWVSPGHGE